MELTPQDIEYIGDVIAITCLIIAFCLGFNAGSLR